MPSIAFLLQIILLFGHCFLMLMPRKDIFKATSFVRLGLNLIYNNKADSSNLF